LLAAAGGQDALLADLAAGKTVVTIARNEAPFAGSPGAPARFEGGRVRGTKYFVPFAAAADGLLVATGDGVCLVQKPLAVTALATLDPGQRFGEVRLDHAATLVGPPGLLERVDLVAAVGAGYAPRHHGAAPRDDHRPRADPTGLPPPDRRLPGAPAPPGRHAAQDRVDAFGRLSRGVVPRHERCGRGARLRRGAPRVRRGDPDARRDRLYLGARPALLLQAREDARAALRVDGEPARAGARRGGVLEPDPRLRLGSGTDNESSARWIRADGVPRPAKPARQTCRSAALAWPRQKAYAAMRHGACAPKPGHPPCRRRPHRASRCGRVGIAAGTSFS